MLLPSFVIEQGWTRNVAARDNDGCVVDPFSSDAHYWCAGSAIEYAFQDREFTMYKYQAKIQRKILPYHTVALWNDSPNIQKKDVLDTMHQVEEELNLVQTA